jgi:hypothetical protein
MMRAEMSNAQTITAPVKARPKLWTPEVLADYLGVPVTWIYKRTRKNGPELIPHIKLGKYVRFDPESEAFQQWLNRHATALSTNTLDGESDAKDQNLTIAFPSRTVRSTEKTGQIS